jgi:hypothetical protein
VRATEQNEAPVGMKVQMRERDSAEPQSPGLQSLQRESKRLPPESKPVPRQP